MSLCLVGYVNGSNIFMTFYTSITEFNGVRLTGLQNGRDLGLGLELGRLRVRNRVRVRASARGGYVRGLD